MVLIFFSTLIYKYLFYFRKLWGLFFDTVHDPSSYGFDLYMFIMCACFQFIFHLNGYLNFPEIWHFYNNKTWVLFLSID